MQIVCMSATMSGLEAMCAWLGARLFMTNFRPVPLTEHAVFSGKVFVKLAKTELEAMARERAGGGLLGDVPLTCEVSSVSRLWPEQVHLVLGDVSPA